MALPVTVESVASAARDVAIASLHQLLGDRLSTVASVREQHGKDASYHPCVPPDAVAFTQSPAEVSEIVKICARHKVPIIPFGSGTGLEGQVVALRGGVSIDISRICQDLLTDPFDNSLCQRLSALLAPLTPKAKTTPFCVKRFSNAGIRR